MGQKTREREGQVEELVGDQSPGPEAPPRSKKEQERREQRKCQERSNCQRSDGEGSGSLRGRRSEEMTQSNTSSQQGSEVPHESQRG